MGCAGSKLQVQGPGAFAPAAGNPRRGLTVVSESASSFSVVAAIPSQWQKRFEVELAAAAARGPMLQTINTTRVTLDEMDDIIFNLHNGLSPEVKSKPLRLMRVESLLKWEQLKCYEQVEPQDCLEMPYSETTDDLWHECAVVSWRWHDPKPQAMDAHFSPMSQVQLLHLQVILHQAKECGIAYVWIDWSCVPQYSDSPMVEVLRSKLFYGRARFQIVLPQFKPLPSGVVSALLHNVVRAARKQHGSAGMEGDMGLAITTLSTLLERGEVAGREYFGRVWTLAERLARGQRGEKLQQWMSLDIWLGMVVDALLNSDKDRVATDIYWSKLMPARLRQQLDNAMDKLKVALTKENVQAPEGLEVELMAVFEGAVEAWRTSSMSEVPNKDWLKLYLTKEAVKVYQAFDSCDLVWAVSSYFTWKQPKKQSISAVQEALQNLCEVVEIECTNTTIHEVLEQAAEKERMEEERHQQEERAEKERLEREQAEKREAEMQRLAEEQAQRELAAKELELKRQAEILAKEQAQRELAAKELELKMQAEILAKEQVQRELAAKELELKRQAEILAKEQVQRELAAKELELNRQAEILAKEQAQKELAAKVKELEDLEKKLELRRKELEEPAPAPLTRNAATLAPTLATQQVSGPSSLSQMIKSKEPKLTCAATWKHHQGDVNCLALSRDGATLVSASIDGTLAVCDAATGRLSCTLQGHTHWVHCVVLTPDGRSAISGSNDKTIRVWSLAPPSPAAAAGQGSGGGAAMALLGAPQVTTSEGNVWSMALSGDGRLLATGHGRPHHILLWRVELQHQSTSQSDEHAAGGGGGGGVVLRRLNGCGPLTGHSHLVESVVMTRDGKTLVSGSRDHTMRVWSLPGGQCLRTIKGHSYMLSGLALTPDEAILVSASSDKDRTVRLWQLSSGAQLACIKGSRAVAVSADGSTLVSRTEDEKQVAVWDLASIMRDPAAHHQPRTTTTECDERPIAFAIAPDGSCVFSGHLGGSVRLWRPTLSP